MTRADGTGARVRPNVRAVIFLNGPARPPSRAANTDLPCGLRVVDIDVDDAEFARAPLPFGLLPNCREPRRITRDALPPTCQPRAPSALLPRLVAVQHFPEAGIKAASP
jgi:hypothetical protein